MAYHFKQMWMAMRGNFTATLATLATMTITLTLLGLVALLTLNLERIAKSLEQDFQISAELSPSATTDEANKKGERAVKGLAGISGIREARFVPKLEALNNLLADFPFLASSSKLVQNPLPDRIVVRPQNPNDIGRIAEKVKQLPDIAAVEFGQEYVVNAVRAIQTIRGLGLGLVVLLLLNSLFNILNTIRVAMYARRDEINVMRLIGATRGFIRMPYVLEGVTLGLLAGIITAMIVLPSYAAAIPQIQAVASFLPFETDPGAVWRVIFMLIGLGAFLGLLGSIWAANRYLREVE